MSRPPLSLGAPADVAVAEIGLDHGRIVAHRVRRALRDLGAVVEHIDAVGELHHHVELVLDQQDRQATRLECRRSAPASPRSRSGSCRRSARRAAAGSAAAPARGRSRRGGGWRRRGCRRDGRGAAVSRSPNSARISRASASSAAFLAFDRRRANERQRQFGERADQRPPRARRAEPRVGADQHIVSTLRLAKTRPC